MGGRLTFLTAVLGICVLVSAAAATTRRVPTEYATIQGAIWASAPGDTVQVLPGTYVENIVIDREVLVRSAQGPAVTVIDGSQPANPDSTSTVRMSAGKIEGFDIQNGTGTYDDNISFEGAWTGGGIYVAQEGIENPPAVEIKNNWIHGNVLPAGRLGYGGGIFWYGPVVRVVGNRIYDNHIMSQIGDGGGIAGLVRDPLIGYFSLVDGNEIYDNRVRLGLAAGMALGGTARNNIIACNSVDTLYAYSQCSALIVSGDEIEGNTIVANWCANAAPPAVLVRAPDLQPPMLVHLTRNNIAYNLGPGVECELEHHLGQVSFECNNIGFNSGPPVIGECGEVIGQNNNISVEPAFGRGSCPYTPGDFCLAPDSPLLPANSPPGCGLIGAVGECAPDAVSEAEVGGSPFAALGARPNPFVERTVIAFHLLEQAEVEVAIYGVPGRRVRTLRAGVLGAGDHELAWDGRGDDGRRVASGAYVARIRAGSREVARTLLLVR